MTRLAKQKIQTKSHVIMCYCYFPGGFAGKESTGNVGDLGSILGLGRSPGEGNGYPLQYCVLKNSLDRGVWQTTVCGVPKSQTRLNDFIALHGNSKEKNSKLCHLFSLYYYDLSNMFCKCRLIVIFNCQF